MGREDILKRSEEILNFSFEGLLKIQFINHLYEDEAPEKTLSLMLTVINSLAVYEKKIGESIIAMSKDQILSFLKQTKSTSIISLKVYLSIVRRYASFIDCANEELEQISIEDLQTCIDEDKLSKKNVTEKEYVQILQLRDTDNTINYQDLAMVVLLWRGIKGSEYIDIAEFKKKDFDYVNGTLSYKGRTIKLLPIESEILRKCIEETTYRHYGTKSREERVVELVSESDNLFKETAHFNAESKLSYSSIKIRLSYFIREKVKDISATDIYASGVIYNILKENDFKKMRVVDLDTKIKQAYQKISYNRLNILQEEMLKKIQKE